MAPLLLCFALPPLLLLLPRHATAASSNDTLRAGEHISTTDVLVSSDGIFALGFYNSSPNSIYLAIWYNLLRRPVWVANRDRPLRSSAGNLTLSPSSSTLLLTDAQGTVLWSAGAGAVAPYSPGATAVLFPTGNLVLRGGDGGILWESSDNLTDTILTGTDLWSNRAAGTASSLRSWSSDLDPSPGNFTFGIDRRNPAQFVTWRGSQAYWRSNVWGGAPSAGITMGRYILYLTISRNTSWTNVSFGFNDATKILYVRLNYTGTMDLLEWNRATADWSVAYRFPALSCEVYSSCGPFGVCDGTVEPASCTCLYGFEPKNRTEWGSGRYGGGCVRLLGPVCGGGDEMVSFGNMKLPDQFVLRSDLDKNACSGNCTRNCSCTAYAYSDPNSSPDPASSSTGCLMWFGELIDMVRQNDTGSVLYVRIASSKKGKGYQTKVITVVASLLGAIVFTTFMCFTWKRTKYLREKCNGGRDRKEDEEALPGIEGFNIHAEQGNLDLPLLDFEVLVAATDNFSDSLKIGQGGFGKVYKGILPSGVEVAIKRLSKGSGQGLEEFKNEVVLIAQIQHRNLVRLLGCCLKGGERLLIYEYMPNKSLDFFLFGDFENKVLDWERRFSIIKGIARGLLYLHEDSRLTIIHRDLKSSNVLLDGDMNPRISDFGMARIFGGNQNQANTVRIAGTYGYMSPEYAMEGIFSVKSDVYSFGVLLLEIITGQRNTGFRHSDKYFSLLSYAWEMRNDGRLTDIVDPLLGDSYSISEIERCAHVGLLCVQDRMKNRPAMSWVVFMLENSSPMDAVPQKPTFTPKAKHAESSSAQRRTPDTASLNSLTLTAVQCR